MTPAAGRLSRVERGRGAEDALPDRETVALLLGLAEIVRSRQTKAGHLAQVVTQEHRGNCPANKPCTPACVNASVLLERVTVIAERFVAEQDARAPVQPALLDWEEVAG